VSGDLPIPPSRGLPGGLVIPEQELRERFSRSSGPGGQSVNTTDSRVELSWSVLDSAVLSPAQRAGLLDRLAPRLVDGVLVIAASEHRSQLQNRLAARARLVALVRDALVPPTPRRASRPTRASRLRRLESKRHRSQLKSGRGRVEPD
jgi:ribosome-associated protein